MDERDMTIRYVAEQLGVSMALARRYLMLWETVPTHWPASLSCLESPRNSCPVLRIRSVAPPGRFQF